LAIDPDGSKNGSEGGFFRRPVAEATTWHFRFTIRDLLWLTAVVSVLAAWRVDRSRLSDRCELLVQSENKERLQEADAAFAAARIRIIKLENEVQRLKVQAANQSE
jgi:hypothetical protein